MKKLFFAIAAVAMVFATSCKKESVNGAEEPVVAGDNEFVCVIDQNANPQNAPMIEDGMGTMAHIDANNNVWWQVGDDITYYGQRIDETGTEIGAPGYYTLTCSRTSDNKAYFSDASLHFDQGTHVAYYPATLYKTGDGLYLPNEFTIPTGKNAAFLPMYGTGSGTHYLTFHNICAVLKITMPVAGDKYILTSDDDIAGEFYVDDNTAVLTGDNGFNTITVSGSFSAGQVVYVAIPEGNYTNFTFELFNNNVAVYQTPANNINVEVNKIYPVGITVPNPLLQGAFSVSATKQVQFTRGNLYWNGNNWHMEANQAAYPTTWNSTHVGHFYFSDNASGMCGQSQPTSTPTGFYFAEGNNINVEGATGYYVLSAAEWDYLLNPEGESTSSRPNATNLWAFVQLDGAYYLIIAPDNHNYSSKPLSGYTTLSDANSDNIVCLPFAGTRSSNGIDNQNSILDYHSSTITTGGQTCQSSLVSYQEWGGYTYIDVSCKSYFNVSALSIRLVKTVPSGN